MAALIYILTKNNQVFPFFHTLSETYNLIFLIKTHPNRLDMMSQSSFICIFLMSDFENFFLIPIIYFYVFFGKNIYLLIFIIY